MVRLLLLLLWWWWCRKIRARYVCRVGFRFSLVSSCHVFPRRRRRRRRIKRAVFEDYRYQVGQKSMYVEM